MGLDTYTNFRGDYGRYRNFCKKWLKKRNLIINDVALERNVADRRKFDWHFCSSRTLVSTIRKIQESGFLRENHFDFFRNMSCYETLKIGKETLKFFECASNILPKSHKLPMWYEGNKPGGYENSRYLITYVKKQALWFVMVGECGYSTRASF